MKGIYLPSGAANVALVFHANDPPRPRVRFYCESRLSNTKCVIISDRPIRPLFLSKHVL